jgi:hypothetical protein
VTWSDPSELVAIIKVEVTSGDARGSRRRTIAFKQSDARVERWRTVGLTIATLVGDVQHPNEAGAPPPTAAGSSPGATSAAGQPAAPTAAVPGATAATSATGPPRDATGKIPTAATQPITGETQPAPPAAGPPRTHTSWVSLLAVTGPGLEEDGWRFGGRLEFGYRPTKLPLFGRIAVAYAIRPADSAGLSVAWETLSLGGGAAFAFSSLSLEPRISLGIENVHASVSDVVTRANDSGNQLGVNVRGGLDAVWQWPRFGIVGSFEGWRAHAPTQVVVSGQNAGVSSAWGWDLGLGGRLYLD